jgi:heme/copper-type cytochrome/quinol oxidase subunit 2
VQVLLVFKSSDYIYTFTLPAFNLKEIAVPDMEFTARLCVSGTGIFDFRGDELCGGPDSRLDGRLFVEPHDQFLDWYEGMSPEAD